MLRLASLVALIGVNQICRCGAEMVRFPLQTMQKFRTQTNKHRQGSAAASSVPVENLDEMQFFGTIGFGTPPQNATVVFDTGSGELVITSSGCKTDSGLHCQGSGAGYDLKQSSTGQDLHEDFAVSYGSGDVSGITAMDTATCGNFKANNMRISAARKQADVFSEFYFDGIFGLSLSIEPGHESDLFQQFIDANPDMEPVFAMYLTPEPNQPGSELTFGGIDKTRVPQDALWQWADVIKFPTPTAHDYWAVEMSRVVFVWPDSTSTSVLTGHASATSAGSTQVSKNLCNRSGGCQTVIDSGTTMIAIAMNVYQEFMDALTKGNTIQCQPSEDGITVDCTGCEYADFPSIQFTFDPNADFVLEPHQYMDCKGGVCQLALGPHMVMDDEMDFWIFGDYFMRKYYTAFDHGLTGDSVYRMGFACVWEGCSPKVAAPVSVSTTSVSMVQQRPGHVVWAQQLGHRSSSSSSLWEASRLNQLINMQTLLGCATLAVVGLVVVAAKSATRARRGASSDEASLLAPKHIPHLRRASHSPYGDSYGATGWSDRPRDVHFAHL